MPDREKLIAALGCTGNECKNCPYHVIDSDELGAWGWCDAEKINSDAIELLKGQTAQWIWDRPHHFRCSGCNAVVGQKTYLYCPNCGREMRLEETERRKEWHN